ncbi:TspO/MBR family protein [Paenibacillus luteus]|uniref:TspO/MBR family protein n=1 Tax=Paenibacillus luteus TaxID=2545753 RepID=UPI001144FF03|nr:TspO/MBR family protein [Paenibacillus luteus]
MKKSLKWINVIGLAIVLIINGLAQWLPINGKTTGELSAKYPVLITPAPYAFSIWSLIYLLLIGFVIYQFTRRAANNKNVQNIGPWFLISCLLNVAWILVWHYEKLMSSMFVMIALLLSLITIYLAIRSSKPSASLGESLLVRLPFSVYLGWISTATIVNVSVVLYASDWDGFGLSDITWTVILLVIASLLALAFGFGYNDAAYILVFVWSFIAIAVKDGQASQVTLAAYIGAAVLAVAAVYVLFMARKRKSAAY